MLDKTIKIVSSLQRQGVELLNEKENPLDYTIGKSWYKRLFYFCLRVYRGFIKNRCFARSSGLSYATLLALIPVLALVISLSASLLKTQAGEQQIIKYTQKAISFAIPQLNLLGKANIQGEALSADQVNQDKIIEYINTFIDNIRGGALGVTGFISLLTISILLICKIEEAVNDIWHVQTPRDWGVRIFYYWGMLTLVPLVLLLGISLLSYEKFTDLLNVVHRVPILGSMTFIFLTEGASWLVSILGFTAFYYFMPSTRVSWSAAFVGGTFTGILWQLNSMYSALYASNVVSYSKVYGILAAVPILLVGLYFSWIIVLLGCQVAYVWQTRQSYLQNHIIAHIGQEDKELAAMRIMTAIGLCFSKGLNDLTAEKISKELQIPHRLVAEILCTLMQHNLLVKIPHFKEDSYMPAYPLEQISCSNILAAMRQSGEDLLQKTKLQSDEKVCQTFKKICQVAQKQAQEITIQDIISNKK